MAKKCAFCNQKLGNIIFRQRIHFKDGIMCYRCITKYHVGTSSGSAYAARRYAKNHTVQDFKNIIDQGKDFTDIQENYLTDKEKKNIQAEQKREQAKAKYEKTLADFKANESDYLSYYIFSDKKQQILVKKGILRDPRVINYSDIISYHVNQQGHNQSKHHGITRAVVGGALAGGVGAIVGATTGHKQTDYIDHLGLVVNLKDGSNFELVFIRKIDQCKSNSFTARECIKQLNSYASWLDSIIAKNQNQPVEDKAKTDSADEIAKYKKLADEGIITQKEFEAKKKRLLNL